MGCLRRCHRRTVLPSSSSSPHSVAFVAAWCCLRCCAASSSSPSSLQGGVIVFVAAGVVGFVTAGVVVFIAAWHRLLSSLSLHGIVAFSVVVVIAVALAAVQLSEHQLETRKNSHLHQVPFGRNDGVLPNVPFWS
jgi:hypothetical protein